MNLLRVLTILIGLPMIASAAEPSWPDLKDTLYGDEVLSPAGPKIVIDAPYRTENDARARISASVLAPTGTLLESVTLILDDNPMPVSAVFKLKNPLPTFFFDVTMRVNGPTPVHVVAKGVDGRLIVADTFVKTSGLGACSAPPGSDPAEALATLGNITIGISDIQRTASLHTPLSSNHSKVSANQSLMKDRRLDLGISHPSHSGMQMDQISLLFIPMRYVEIIEVDLDGQGFVEVTGSISLSENPEVSLSVPSYTGSVDVTMTDTSGTVTKANKSLTGF